MSNDTTCSVHGCEKESIARGWCPGHYRRWRNTGDVQADVPLRARKLKEKPAVCTVGGCDLKAGTRGLCSGHYDRLIKTGDVRADVPLKVNGSQKNKACSVDGCDRPSFSRDWCRSHYQRWYSTGDVQSDVPINGHLREYPEGCSWCPRCEKMLPLDKFHISRDRARGVTALCAQCISEDQKARRPQIYEQQRRWLRANPGKSTEYSRNYSRRYPEKIREKQRRLVANNPEKYRQIARAAESNRRAREQNAPGFMTTDQLNARWAYYGGRCWICGGKATVTDHVKPLSKGGSNWPSNARPACVPCNASKNAKWPFKPEDIAHIWAA